MSRYRNRPAPLTSPAVAGMGDAESSSAGRMRDQIRAAIITPAAKPKK